ncbi:MAG: hypothetical protein HQL90_10405 [Magnetococcales bacterium]|nr:hypothetical protein [Magnetococcales bacterium]
MQKKIISDAGLEIPDHRPLHGYPCSLDTFTELREVLASCIAEGQLTDAIAAKFVFWAAEHIRSRFNGGQLTWAFVFDGLGFFEDRTLGVKLVEQGLLWWNRKVRISEAGHRMFLYSLMAEGGLPQALLSQKGLYRRVVMGLLAEIEAEGGRSAAHIAEQIAFRWAMGLPQTFQTEDFVRLLADLVLSLCDLRAAIPVDLSSDEIENWLNVHRPGWRSELPLRMTPETAEALIRPALRSDRNMHAASAFGPLSVRELWVDESKCWHGFLRMNDDGWLPSQLLPDAGKLWLRLLPVRGNQRESLSYSASPDTGGWRLHRIGRMGGLQIPLAPQETFALAAFADGQAKGEVVIDPGLPASVESPSFWKSLDPDAGFAATRLVLHPGAGRTRALHLWMLTAENVTPDLDGGLSIHGPDIGPGGWLWRLTGTGHLHLEGVRFRIETGAGEDMVDARLHGFGDLLDGWRHASGAPVHRGGLAFYGEIGTSGLRSVPTNELRRWPGRNLCSEIVEWVRSNEIIARLRIFCLPAAARIDLREEMPGRVTMLADGLASGWHMTLRAGAVEVRGEVISGMAEISLAVDGVAPGVVSLRLFDPSAGRSAEVYAPWPSRKGMILDPDGVRLSTNRPIAAEELRGWRAVVPTGNRGDLQLKLFRHAEICLPVVGEVSLAAYLPLIGAMQALGGPDAVVYLSLVVGGEEGRRLEIRRYHEQTRVENGILHRIGAKTLPIDLNAGTVHAPDGNLWVHAVDLSAPDRVVQNEDAPSLDLRVLLGDEGGPWLIQSRLNRRIQRAVVWSASPLPRSSRDVRIEKYAAKWRELVSAPEDPEWNLLLRLITVVSQGGDAGVLDQVQALAKAPSAAVSLALRVPIAALPEYLALDTIAPIFWPILPVGAFVEAVRSEHSRQIARFSAILDEHEAVSDANSALMRRIVKILTLRPELGAHFDQALLSAGLSRVTEVDNVAKSLNPVERLRDLAQDAARRFDQLPNGISVLKPCCRPHWLSFNSYVQPLIDAPLIAAEVAIGRRIAPSVVEMLTLINLRLLDPGYFDCALPAALTFYLTDQHT